MVEATSFWIFVELSVRHFLLAVEHGQQFLQPFADGNGFEQFLAVVQGEVQVRGDEVGEVTGMLGVERGDLDLVGQRGGTSWRSPRIACARCVRMACISMESSVSSRSTS